MSGTLDLSSFFKTIENDDEVNLPPDVMAIEIKKREARAKKQAQESALEKRIESLEKIEKKTDRLLEKAKKIKEAVPEPLHSRSKTVPQPYKSRTIIKRKASLLEYRCMRGLKKIILLSITKNMSKEGAITTSIIDTEEIIKTSGKSAVAIRKAILSMKDEGWFEVTHSSNSGVRIVTINPDNYPTLQ